MFSRKVTFNRKDGFNDSCYGSKTLIIAVMAQQPHNNMFYHAWTWLLIYHESNNVVQVCLFIKPWTVCSNMHEQACQQHCSRLSTTMFKLLASSTMFQLASSTMHCMFKPVNRQNQAVCFYVCMAMAITKNNNRAVPTCDQMFDTIIDLLFGYYIVHWCICVYN